MNNAPDVRKILQSHITMLNAALDRISVAISAISVDDPRKDELNKIHLELSNIVAVMKADLANLP
jgi:hypothetical protein